MSRGFGGSRVYWSLACAVFCLCSAAASAAIHAASGYVQNGLYNHWDGFENAGAGLAHDASATTWANLAPGASDRVWHINSHAEWKDFGLHFKGTGLVDNAGPSSMLSWSNGCCTVEFIYSNEKKDHTILFGLSYQSVLYAYTDSAWHVGFRGGSAAASYGVAVPSETYT